MADVEVKAKLSVDTGDSAQKIEVVKKGLKSTGAETSKTAGSFNKLKGEIAGLPGPAGQATQSLGLVTQALNVLKAHPIIGIFILIAGLIIAIVKRMSEMDAITGRLEKTWGMLSGVMSAFMDKVLTPLITAFSFILDSLSDGLIWLFDKLGISSAETSRRIGDLTEKVKDLEDAENDASLAIAASNRKMQEAREIAADANLPIGERIAALKEAAAEEKKQLDFVVKINLEKTTALMELYAREINAKDDVINKIKEGTVESLKAARAELLAMSNVNKDKVFELDQYIKAAEEAQQQSSKINTKAEKQITSLQREEQSKRDAIAKEAAERRKQRLAEEKAERERAEKERIAALDRELAEYKKRYDAQIQFTRDQRLAAEAEEVEKEKRMQRDIARQNQGIANQLAGMQVIKDKDAEAVAYEQVLTDTRISFKERVASAIGGLADLVGRQTALGKTLAIAEIALGTGVGFIQGLDIAQKSAKATGPGAAFAFPIFYATQIAAVLAAAGRAKAALSSVKGGSSGGSVSAPSIQSVSSPVLPRNQTTALDSNSIQAIGNAAAGGVNRSFVLDRDITNNAERNQRLNRAARLG